jgi:tetratricopeptide (TPR) repeat protein
MKRNLGLLGFAALLVVLSSAPVWAQTTQVEGKITDSGKALTGATVTLTNLGTNRNFKTKSDKNGNIQMVGVPVGDYEVEVTGSDGDKLYKQKMTISPDQTSGVAQVMIDVSQGGSAGNQGKQNQPAQTGQPAQPGQPGQGTGQQQPKYTKEQIEEIKKQNEKAQNFNALIQQVNTALAAKNWQDAVTPLQQLIEGDPTNWQYYSGLGDAQTNLEQYDQAVETYQKGIQAAQNNTTVDPKNPITDPARKKAGIGHMLTSEGNDYLKLHKNKEAVDAYTQAASMDPNPGVAFFNLCATQYNTGNTEGALDACDKAIAADPNKADAYFIKGSLMIASSKTDKDGKVVAPPGTAETLNKYLQLAPDGPHAKDVKDMLTYIGSTVENTYKKKGK